MAGRLIFTLWQRAITPRTRAIVVVNPNNPTGHFCKPDDMHRLNQICLESDLAIIADEVFLDFSLRQRHCVRASLRTTKR